MGRLTGKTAIITGTGSGMGRAAALLFAREGAQVVGCDIDAARGEKVVEDVRRAGGAMVSLHPLDLSNADGAEALIAFALDNYGGFDILYNNAAMAYFAWVADMEYDTFSRTMKEEVDIIFHLTRAAWPHLVARGGVGVPLLLGRGVERRGLHRLRPSYRVAPVDRSAAGRLGGSGPLGLRVTGDRHHRRPGWGRSGGFDPSGLGGSNRIRGESGAAGTAHDSPIGTGLEHGAGEPAGRGEIHHPLRSVGLSRQP